MASNLETELDKLIDDYPEDVKRNIIKEFNKLELDCKNLVKQIIPQEMIPVYMSMVNSDRIEDREKVTTWNDYQPVGEFSEFNDQYCRPVKMVDSVSRIGNPKGSYMYPERQINGEIKLKDCNVLFNDNMKEIADISGFIPAFIDMAKREMVNLERNNVSDVNNITQLVDNKISEFENLEKQRVQNEKLINNHHQFIKDRKDMIDEKEDKLDEGNNDYNIKRDTLKDFLKEEEDKIARNNTFRTIIKGVVFILWCIVIGLVLFHNIGYIK